MTMNDLLLATHERYWLSSKSETTTMGNAQNVVDILGPSRPASSITEVDIEALIRSLKATGNAPATINRKLATLSKMLKHGARIREIKSPPVIERLREPRGRLRYLSPVEQEVLRDTLRDQGDPDTSDLVGVLVDTGMRLSEALRLLWVQVEPEWVRLWDTKNGGERSIPLTKQASGIFKGRRGVPKGPFSVLSKNKVEYAWRKARTALGLEGDREFVLHALRHTFCSRLAQRGVPIATIQKLAGHASLAMTMRYSHLAPENLREAVSVLEKSG